MNGTYNEDEKAYYGCHKGFEISNLTSKCENGTWSPTVKCTGKINTYDIHVNQT